jgi:hypothetical protein
LHDPTGVLNDCHCCEGISSQTPVVLYNRPGLTAIAYRAGTHSDFKATLLARLSAARQPPLGDLRTRDDDDFSIALLDGWATVADVLTFYQERIANENYLRTATERLSIRELARLIGYELRPGVAASTHLAFTIEDAPGAFGQALTLAASAQSAPEFPPPVTIPERTKVQSIPGPGEQAQTFETIETIDARSDWNAIRPRMYQPQVLHPNMASLILAGTATNLRVGDNVLLNLSTKKVKKVLKVTPDESSKTTRIELALTPALSPAEYLEAAQEDNEGNIDDFSTQRELDDEVIGELMTYRWHEADLSALAEIQGWNPDVLARAMNGRAAQSPAAGPGDVHAMRQRAAVFGYNAPKDPEYYPTSHLPMPMSAWDDPSIDAEEAGQKLYLDNAYEGVLPESYVAVTKPPAQPEVYKISSVSIEPRTAYGISSKTTLLTLFVNWWTPSFNIIRKTAVLVQSELLPAAQVPIEQEISGDTVRLDRVYIGLKVGRRIILTGERNDLPGAVHSEVRLLKEVLIEAGFTIVKFDKALQYNYVRSTVLFNANVALATHGETVQEVLGGGDASQVFQQFTLRQPPLTHVSAATPSGTESTLEIRVNDILWEEVPFLYGHAPGERIFKTEMDDDGKTRVMFGDGATGERLPTGQANITAKYRKGIGLVGRVPANRLTQALTPPLGIKAVTNPQEATGAGDPESLADARQNAPLTVLTLDRIVSLQDYEDFARAFAGIGKAQASWLWSGQKRGVFVTAGGADGGQVASELLTDLLDAMRKFGDAAIPLWVKSYEPRLFRLLAKIFLDPAYLAEKVVPEIESQLRLRFSFAERRFAQPVHSSEVIALIQGVEGVVAVDLDEIYRTDQPGQPSSRLNALPARLSGGEQLPAELVTLDPGPIGLEVAE